MDIHLININWDIVLRIAVAIVLGFIIGIERELTNKSAGLRTHILVCLGSATFTILSIYAFPVLASPKGVSDPARVAAQILTGIGFIGGGTVLRQGSSISGLTTAASLWVSASIGMAAGVGSYSVAFLTAIMAVLVLVAIRKLEVGFLSRFTRKGARIKATVLCNAESGSEILNWFYKEFSSIVEMNQKKVAKDEDMIKITFIFDLIDSNPVSKAYKKIKELKNIDSLSLQQVFDEGN